MYCGQVFARSFIRIRSDAFMTTLADGHRSDARPCRREREERGEERESE